MLLRLLAWACISEHLQAARSSRCLVGASHYLTGTMLAASCDVGICSAKSQMWCRPYLFFFRSRLSSVRVCLASVSAPVTAQPNPARCFRCSPR